MRTAPLLAALTTGLLLTATIAVPAAAASPGIDLGSATTYSVLAGGSISNTGSSVVAGNVGAGSAISGMPAASVAGVVHRNDAPAWRALADAKAAYAVAASRPRDGGAITGELGGQTLTPGTYYSSQPQTITGDVIFDAQGDPGAVFVVQVDAPLTTLASTTMRLLNGADASRIYWQVLGDATLGASSTFVGTLLSASIINLGAGSTITGRALAINSPLSLDTTTLRSVWATPHPAISIDGGATRGITVPGVKLSGAATSEVGHTVVVRVGETRYSSLIGADGRWTVAIDSIASGEYAVSASVTDPGGTASAQQRLSVAIPVQVPPKAAPVVTISGGARVFTKDRTPRVAGRSTGAAGSSVVVKVGAKTRTAKVSASGTWSVVLPKLRYRTYTVTAKSSGAVSAKQKVVVRKRIPPKITIVGGAVFSTDDRTPTIAGRTTAKVGSKITVTLGGKKRSTAVRPGKNWSVTFPAVKLGTHTVIVAAKSSAGTNTVTQRLTVEPGEMPEVWTVGYLDQVVQGTSDAPVGTPVSVTVGILLFSTQVQAGGIWGVRLNQQPVGTHAVTISAGGVTERVTLVVASGAFVPSAAGCGAVSPNGEAVLAFGGHSLSASVHQFGVWTPAPAKISDCGYLVVPSVTDETASTGTFSRTPISGSTTPVVTINGGDRATDDPGIRDISGTTTAAPGSLVRMRMAGQTVETTVTPEQKWSFYRNDFAPGTHQLVVSVSDPSRGAGYVAQALTIG